MFAPRKHRGNTSPEQAFQNTLVMLGRTNVNTGSSRVSDSSVNQRRQQIQKQKEAARTQPPMSVSANAVTVTAPSHHIPTSRQLQHSSNRYDAPPQHTDYHHSRHPQSQLEHSTFSHSHSHNPHMFHSHTSHAARERPLTGEEGDVDVTDMDEDETSVTSEMSSIQHRIYLLKHKTGKARVMDSLFSSQAGAGTPFNNTAACAQQIATQVQTQLQAQVFLSWYQIYKAVSFRNSSLLFVAFRSLHLNRVRGGGHRRRDSREKYSDLLSSPHPQHCFGPEDEEEAEGDNQFPSHSHSHSHSQSYSNQHRSEHTPPHQDSPDMHSMVSDLTYGYGEDDHDHAHYQDRSPLVVSSGYNYTSPSPGVSSRGTSVSRSGTSHSSGGGGASGASDSPPFHTYVNRWQRAGAGENISTPRASVLHRHRVPTKAYGTVPLPPVSVSVSASATTVAPPPGTVRRQYGL